MRQALHMRACARMHARPPAHIHTHKHRLVRRHWCANHIGQHKLCRIKLAFFFFFQGQRRRIGNEPLSLLLVILRPSARAVRLSRGLLASQKIHWERLMARLSIKEFQLWEAGLGLGELTGLDSRRLGSIPSEFIEWTVGLFFCFKEE